MKPLRVSHALPVLWLGLACAQVFGCSSRDPEPKAEPKAKTDARPGPDTQPAPNIPTDIPAPSILPPSILIDIPTLEARGLDAVEERIAAYIDAHATDAEALIERVVNINSGTMNHEGVREVGRVFAEELQAIGFQTRWIDQSDVDRAGHLFAQIEGTRGKRVLLIGHLDTVFERDSPFQTFERLPDGQARGPGVIDMKSGDVVILLALQALHAQGLLADRRIVVALTGDEESTGKPLDVSRADLVRAAKASDVALGFEGGIDRANSITIARRGFTRWQLEVHGTRGHSSVIFSDAMGAGAAFEASRILSAFYTELRGEPYLTFNAGIVMAGTNVDYKARESRGGAYGKTNVIPEQATAAGDLRTLTTAQRERVKQRMRALVTQGNLPGTSAEITFVDSYPPMAPTQGNRALAAELDRAARDLGLGAAEIVDPGRRGAADISFAAPHADALAGLGAVGQGAHALGETLDLSSVPQVSKRAAILLYRLTSH